MRKCVVLVSVCLSCLALVWSPVWGQPRAERGAKTSTGPLQIAQCRVTLIHDQTLSVGRMGVIEYIGRTVPDGTDENGKPKTKVVKLQEGDEVEENDVIIQLMDEVPAAALETATAEAANDIEVRFQRKSGEFAQAELQVAENANRLSKTTYPEIEIKKLKLASERGSLAIEQAAHQFNVNRLKAKEAAAALETYRVRAPFSGVVTHIHKAKGDTVREGDPVLQLANTTRVRVEGYASIADAARLKRGMKVRVQQEIDDEGSAVEDTAFDGEVIFVDVQVEKVNQKQRVIAFVNNPKGGLLAGRQARMTFLENSVPRATTNAAKP